MASVSAAKDALCSCAPKPVSGPYDLHFLLPYGILQIPLLETTPLCTDPKWHILYKGLLLGKLDDTEDQLRRELEFLIRERFVSATWKVLRHPSSGEALLLIRIYLIPYDLGCVQGKLRIRKDNLLQPARRHLRTLLARCHGGADAWTGTKPMAVNESPLILCEKDNRTLSEIYSDLASPKPVVTPSYEEIGSRLLDFSDDLGGLGLRSTLHQYQRRSVAAMLAKELDRNAIPDPLYITLRTVDREPFYFQPGTGEVLRERPMVAPARGGVLCEELGTGKTVITLALILSTLNQLSEPESSIVDEHPIMTPLSFRHFMSPDCQIARSRFYRGTVAGNTPALLRVPTLVELLLHHSRASPDCSIANTTTEHGLREYERKTHFADQLELLDSLKDQYQETNPFYLHYHNEPTDRDREHRKKRSLGPQKMFLTSATLVVVPANLLSQWDREIQKHCEFPLRVLITRSGTQLPSARILATDYDVILMSYTRLASENTDKKNMSRLRSWNPCKCPELEGTRVPKCRCEIAGVSPLLGVRWKRLVIDEGHVSASLQTILTPFTKMLSVERRWIVTGTPTTNLLGLSFGNKPGSGTGVPQPEVGDEEMFGELDDVRTGFSSPSESPTPSESRIHFPPSMLTSQWTRVWNAYDRQDLHKLGNMITHFVAVPQFISEPKLVQTHIVEPLLDSLGPRPGAVQVLNQVMEMVMIRHRIEDVEKDVILPPVEHEHIMLDLDPYVIKSYNALQATIAINAIDSQRTDQDYMFHPRNADLLQLTLKNMSQLMFWAIDEDLYNTEELVESAQRTIERAIERKMSDEDVDLLRAAKVHVESAAQDFIWRAIQGHEDVPFRVRNMPPAVIAAWTRTPQREPDGTALLHVDRISKIRDAIMERPLTSEDALVQRGIFVHDQDHTLRRLYQASQKTQKRKASDKRGRSQEDHASQKVTKAAKRAGEPEVLKEMRQELDISMARLRAFEMEDGETPLDVHASQSRPRTAASQLIASSVCSKVHVGSSTSSKLNYIVNEVLQHSSTEKFLIFSDSELSLAHIAEALELFQVKYLRFTTQIKPQVREQLVLTFETSPTYRVFLMELKHGARGLNLVSASRVIFCEPVWQADVESQAIKRAHRIGQTRPIVVKTLAIRGTAEETMVARKNALKDSQGKMPKLIEEAGMRHYIANPKFITNSPTLLPTIDVPLFNLPSETEMEIDAVTASQVSIIETDQIPIANETPLGSAPATPARKRIRVGEPLDDDPPQSPRPSPQKKRGVRFV